MQNYHDLPKRKTIRIKNYDYSTQGFYFITICTQNRKNILSRIIQKEEISTINLTSFGKIVENNYNFIIKKYRMKSHIYVIMPNHIHAIIEICDRAGTRPAPTISDVVRDIKSLTTLEYIKLVKTKGAEKFDNKIWQRSYYEHIIRNEKEYFEIYSYVENNPYNWEKDIYRQT